MRRPRHLPRHARTGPLLAQAAAAAALLGALVAAPPQAVVAQGSDTSLTSLALSDVDFGTFSSGTTLYRATSVSAATVGSTTLTYTAADTTAATVTVTPADSDVDTAGYQIRLNLGENSIRVTVSASGSETVYEVRVQRVDDTALGRDTGKDFDIKTLHGLDDPSGIWSDGEIFWVLDQGDNTIHAFDFDTRERIEGRAISTETAFGNAPYCLWSDGTSIWTADQRDERLHAFDLATGEVRADLGFPIRSSITVAHPEGLWSDGTTMWVSQEKAVLEPARIYAWDLATGERRSGRDIVDRSRTNTVFAHLWSDGETMWAKIHGSGPGRGVHAYDLHTGARRSGLDFVNAASTGLWSDGRTMWMADSHTDRIYAYHMPVSAVLRSLELSNVDLHGFNAGRSDYSVRVPNTVTSTTVNAEAAFASSTVSISPDDAEDGTPGHQVDIGPGDNVITVTVTNGNQTRTYNFTVTQVDAAAISSDSTLASLTLTDSATDSDIDLGGFTSSSTSYSPRVLNDVDGITVEAHSTDTAADVSISPDDADAGTPGHQVDLTPGNNPINVRVDSSDGRHTRIYSIQVQRQSLATLAWNWVQNRSLNSDTSRARALWSDGTTVWVLDNSHDQADAYDLATATERSGLGIAQATMRAAGNYDGEDMWSDGETMWVLDSTDDKVYAYDLDTRARLAELDIGGLDAAGNSNGNGLWSDGETMWVADQSDNKVYAYDLDTRARLAALDIGGLRAAGNDSPSGLWSDGVTVWVADRADNKIYAYDLSTGARRSHLDFSESTLRGAGNDDLGGLWSDGRTMWTTDRDDDELYGYTMVEAPLLESFDLSGVDLGHFAVGMRERTVTVPPSVTSITVTAEPLFDGHTVSIEPADDDGDSVNGHQVSVVDKPVTIRVTVDDGSGSRTYTVTVRGPVVSIGHVGSDPLVEGDDVVFTVRHDGTVSEALAVTVNVDAPASLVDGSDIGERRVEIAAGMESATLTVPTVDGDGWAESSVVTARLVAGSGYSISSTLGFDSLRVNDNDFPEATARLDVSRDTVAEGDSVTATVTVTTARDEQPHEGGGTIRLRTADGTATAGSDYTALSATAGTLRFAESDFGRVNVDGGAMRYRASRQATITTVDDAAEEQAETFTVSMTAVTTGSSPTDSNIELAAPTSRRVTIAAGGEHRVTSVTIGGIHKTGATATVRVANPSSTRQEVHLRYSTDGATWSDPPEIRHSTEPSLTFPLAGLEPGTQYQVQASLDTNFATGVETATFTTASTTPIITGVTDPITTPIITGSTPGGRGTTGVSGHQDDGGGDPDTDEGGFSDLGDAGIHEADVRALASEGVLAGTGCGNGRLCPDDAIPRWEIAVWLVRVLDGDDPEPGKSRFDDIDDQAWWAPHVERLADLEITKGCSTDPLSFCPHKPVKRSQMASFLVRAYNLAPAAPAGFEDTTTNAHKENIDALHATGITKGCSTDPLLFCPQTPTTRAQMAAFLNRARSHGNDQS